MPANNIYALSVVMTRVKVHPDKTETTTRPCLAWRQAESADAALGGYVHELLEDATNEGFALSSVQVLQIPRHVVEGETD